MDLATPPIKSTYGWRREQGYGFPNGYYTLYDPRKEWRDVYRNQARRELLELKQAVL